MAGRCRVCACARLGMTAVGAERRGDARRVRSRCRVWRRRNGEAHVPGGVGWGWGTHAQAELRVSCATAVSSDGGRSTVTRAGSRPCRQHWRAEGASQQSAQTICPNGEILPLS
eukprot:3744885-Prymnesium_polylepis.1